MSRLHHCGYFPLTEHAIRSNVPTSAGLYLLAVPTAENRFHNFYTTYSDNIAASLLVHLEKGISTPAITHSNDGRTRCYFAYVLLPCEDDHMERVGKLLLHTADPVTRLDVISCN